MEIIAINSQNKALVFDLFNKYRIFYKQPSDLELATKFISERVDNNESYIFVAIDNNENNQTPIGFVQIYPAYSSVSAVRKWILNDLFVEPDYRSQKVGLRLIKHAIEFSKTNFGVSIELSTAIDNYTAQRIYEYLGFVPKQAESQYRDYIFTH